MTMHLLRGASSLNTRKPKPKLTKAKLQELEVAWREHNKNMKRRGHHDLRYDTLEDYIAYCYGLVKLKPEFNSMPTQKTYVRETPFYPSLVSTPKDSSLNPTAKKETLKYTGTLIKGIATMHKSNAIPVIDDQHMKDISRMRR
jgi:hypothetical protein